MVILRGELFKANERLKESNHINYGEKIGGNRRKIFDNMLGPINFYL